MKFFKWFSSKKVSIPKEETVIPVTLHVRDDLIVSLNTNGSITGNYEEFENYLLTKVTNVFAEDRIIFWLLLQEWRKQRAVMFKIPSTIDANSPDFSSNVFGCKIPLKNDKIVGEYKTLPSIKIELPPNPLLDPPMEKITEEKLLDTISSNNVVIGGNSVSNVSIVKIEPPKAPHTVILTENGPVTVRYEHLKEDK